jgi:hydroxyacylglutathione hydrolase
VVFVGDVLFAGSVGRTDLPGGDAGTLLASIREKLYALPDGTVVYAGHGPATTIGAEKAHNPFVRLVPGLDARPSPGGPDG